MADVKATMRRFYDEVVNAHNLDSVDDFLSSDFAEREVLPPGIPEGREGVKVFFSMMFEGFPDLRFEVSELLAEGDTAVSRVLVTGTHKGTFMDIPATGKRIEAVSIDIVRFEGDKAVEHWGVTDMMAVMQQIGAVPA